MPTPPSNAAEPPPLVEFPSVQSLGSSERRASALPLVARLLLVDPRAIDARLDRLRESRSLEDVPNAWQLTLGIARMWHRVVFRSDTIGTCRSHPVRRSLRARALAFRPLRFPFLLRERAIAPLDFSGLLSDRERVIRHLLGAHHDANQFAYDLEMLAHEPGALEELHLRVKGVLEDDSPRTRFLRDLVVYEGYHEHLERAVARAIAGDFGLTEDERHDPDISFGAYLGWCARQPKTPESTWRAFLSGRYDVAEGTC
ncbi:MAG: hypothetical protein FJ096_11240 [Deltaproteobacteria bacterium]|nr:hypothetical protein [Deltaproteobacteria bacterium]